MTAPRLATTYDWGRMYARERGGEPEVPSITTVLDVLNQRMEWWEALCAVRLAMDHAERLAEVQRLPEGREKWGRARKAKDWLVDAATRDRDDASARGDLVHNYAEQVCLHQQGLASMDDVQHHEKLCEEGGAAEYLPAFQDFWRTWKPRVLQAEATVWNATVGYAGTTDLICELDVRGQTVVAVCDWKCTTDETPILMADGTTKQAIDVRAGDRVVAWDNGNGTFTDRAVAAVGDNGFKKVVTLRMGGHRQVTVTTNHPILVRRFNKPPGARGRVLRAPKWVDADQVRPGDMVRTDVRVSAHGEPDSLSVEDAYLIGAMVGDGGTHTRTYTFANVDSDVVSAVSAALSAHGLELRLASRNPRNATEAVGCFYLRDPHAIAATGGAPTSVSKFREWFAALGLDGCLSSQKRVPTQVKTASLPARIAFLNGYLDTDGHVRDASVLPPRISWTTASEGLAKDLVELLAGVGVYACATPATRTEGTYWHVGVAGGSNAWTAAQVLASQVGSKESRLERIRNTEWMRPGNCKHAFDGWIPVKSIAQRNTKQHTVAIEVDDLHTHVTGGIVTHNTKRGLFKRNGERKSSDLRDFTGMQLAAAAYAEELWVPGADEQGSQDAWMPFPYQVDVGLAVAIAPDGYVVRQYKIHHPLMFRTFRALRAGWDFERHGKSLMSPLLEGPDAVWLGEVDRAGADKRA